MPGRASTSGGHPGRSDRAAAPHLGPYTDEEPQLAIVERVTTAFLNRFLKHLPAAGWQMWQTGNVRGLAALAW